MSIRVTTLGAVQVVRGDAVLSALPSQRLRCALLIYMAVTRQAPRDRLLALFWPERSEERARHALSQNIYELRRVLGDDWVEVRGEQFITAAHISVDLAAFEESIERGDYNMALGLYRGPFLDGFYVPAAQAFDTWVESVRQRVQRHHRRARREGIKQLVDQARLKEALASARDWAALDPSDDEAQHRLIELLAETGDRAGAIRQYDVYQRMLAVDELQPLDETRALVDRIRGGEVGPLPAPSGVLPSRTRREPIVSPTTAARAEPIAADSFGEPVPKRRLTRRWAVIIGALLVIGVGGIVLQLTGGAPNNASSAAGDPVDVAVLYLEDLSPPPGAAHVANGITEDLISAFSNLDPLLAVRSKHAVAPFRNSSVPWDSMARALAADLIIGGNVVRADGRVRVNVQLVDGSTGVVLEPLQVERADGEFLPLIDDLVLKVQLALRQRMGTQLAFARRRAGAPSSQAWHALQVGIAQVAVAGRAAGDHGVDGLRRELARADSMLRSAEDLGGTWVDPTIQRSLLAEKRSIVELSQANRDGARAWLDTALTHAERAVTVSRQSPAALEARGSVFYRVANFMQLRADEVEAFTDRAEQDLTAASRADPSRAQAFALLGSILFTKGRFNDANHAARQAARLDAFLSQWVENEYNIAMTDFELRRDSDAADRCNDGITRQRKEMRFYYCMLSVMAWSDTEPADPDSAWKLVNTVRQQGWMPDSVDQVPMLEMLVAATLIRANRADSARDVLNRAAARPSTAASPWIEAAVRYRLRDVSAAAAILAESRNRDSTFGPMVLLGRALSPVLADTAVLRALGQRGDP